MTNDPGASAEHEATDPEAHGEHGHAVPIFVNTKEVFTEQKTLNYEQVVQIAFPSGPPGTVYTVVWRQGDKAGHLVAGGPPVHVKAGMMFDVTPTTES